VPTVGACARIGCYTEGYEIRALTPHISTDYGYMYPEFCQSLCPEYSYFGVEYGGEYYCRNSINKGTTIFADSDCNMSCNGFSNEYCGADVRLDIYVIISFPSWALICFGRNGSYGAVADCPRFHGITVLQQAAL
jgi:chitinase